MSNKAYTPSVPQSNGYYFFIAVLTIFSLVIMVLLLLPLARQAQPWLRIGGAVVLLALAIFGGPLNVGVLVTVVVAVFLVQVGLGVNKRLQRPEPAAAESVTPI